MRALLVVALAAFPVVAYAQTTTCGWEMGKWVCRSDQPKQQLDIGSYQFNDPMREYERARQRSYDATRQIYQDHAANERHRLDTLEMVERYIGIGRCDDAERLAFTLGEREGHAVRERCPR